ncbi:MAG: 50S ribosomal protein L4 [Minisyncoccales bacterium]
MKIDIYNKKGNKLKSKVETKKQVFDTDLNQDLIYQVTMAQRANRREGTAHTKGRSERSGGGAKPWAQKGTGRARHGSIRSPLWRKGGVTFGPNKERNYSKKINKKAKRKALFQVLSEKKRRGDFIVLNNINISPKTKEMVNVLNNLKIKDESFLVATSEKNDNVIRATSNIKKGKVMEARELNVLDLLQYKYIILTKDSVKVIEETFLK